jgi:hypothetical protein
MHFGSSAYAESLAGDLIEQFHQGRSRWWYWRQVAIALLLSRADVMPIVFRCAAAVTAVLGLIVITDRFSSPCPSAVTPALITLAALGLGVAGMSCRRAVSLARTLVGTVALIMLGAGTLSWASTTRIERCAGICTCTQARAALP